MPAGVVSGAGSGAGQRCPPPAHATCGYATGALTPAMMGSRGWWRWQCQADTAPTSPPAPPEAVLPWGGAGRQGWWWPYPPSFYPLGKIHSAGKKIWKREVTRYGRVNGIPIYLCLRVFTQIYFILRLWIGCQGWTVLEATTSTYVISYFGDLVSG